MEMEADAEAAESSGPPLQEAATATSDSIDQPPTSPPALYLDEADSACSSPYFSAPSSPGRGGGGGGGGGGGFPIPNYCYYFSAPTSPVHYVLASLPYTADDDGAGEDGVGPLLAAAGVGEVSSPTGSSEFEFSARFSDSCGGGAGARDAAEMMCPADELFLNGQIRPMRLACHLERPQALAPLLDLEGEAEVGVDLEEEEEGEGEEREEKPSGPEGNEFPAAAARGREYFFSKSKLRSRSLHRRARSMSPLRATAREPLFQWRDTEEPEEKAAARSASRRGRRSSCGGLEEEHGGGEAGDLGGEAADAGAQRRVDGEEPGEEEESEEAPTPSASASSSRCSSSSGRNSKRWIFLKDLLYRSKSEGRGNEREREIRDRDRDRFWHNISFSPAKDKAASLFVFSRAAKVKEMKATEAAGDGSTAAAADGAEAPAAASTDPNPAPAIPSADPAKQEGEDEKKKKPKRSPKLKQKLKQKPKKNDEDPGPAPAPDVDTASKATAKPAAAAGVAGKRRTTSAHERHYAAKRAQAEELRKRTFLPYRQGLLGCLGFSSRGYTYTAMSGLARTLNTVSSG